MASTMPSGEYFWRDVLLRGHNALKYHGRLTVNASQFIFIFVYSSEIKVDNRNY